MSSKGYAVCKTVDGGFVVEGGEVFFLLDDEPHRGVIEDTSLGRTTAVIRTHDGRQLELPKEVLYATEQGLANRAEELMQQLDNQIAQLMRRWERLAAAFPMPERTAEPELDDSRLA